MAGFGHFKVISVDYRMPPDHPYPAALDDAMTVWKAAHDCHPKNMAIFGSSAGGNLTLSMVLRAKLDNVPLPGAIAPGTPMSDLTLAGDCFATNAMVDNVLVAPGTNCDARAALYANGHDLKDPMLSPVYGDMRGFPERLATALGHDVLRLAPERREHGGTVGREQVELLGDQRTARQDLIIERARSQRRQKRPVRLEGNAVATRPSRRVDAGITGLRWAGRRRLIVDASHHVDDADRLRTDRHAETPQLGAGEIGIGTRVIEDEFDQHVRALMRQDSGDRHRQLAFRMPST